ncbi:hypothetical protein JCM15519_17700 [Fundidesulfovibrio butyratiphilus]
MSHKQPDCASGRPQVFDLVRTVFGIAATVPLDDSMTFADVPGWDSLGFLNLLAEIEKTYSITLDIEETASVDSLGKLREIVERKI